MHPASSVVVPPCCFKFFFWLSLFLVGGGCCTWTVGPRTNSISWHMCCWYVAPKWMAAKGWILPDLQRGVCWKCHHHTHNPQRSTQRVDTTCRTKHVCAFYTPCVGAMPMLFGHHACAFECDVSYGYAWSTMSICCAQAICHGQDMLSSIKARTGRCC